MNDKIEVPTMQVPPLKRICMTIGQLPTSYLETMSYYEMLVWFVNYLRDDIIPVVNANGQATQELQELFITLQNYVNNYFDNLDIQEEINKKLDEMSEDGSLTLLIKDYVDPIYETYKEQIDSTINSQNQTITSQGNEINVLSSRMDSFTNLTEGSTSGDAELIDGRTSYSGLTYTNIGDAIRGQIDITLDKSNSIGEDTLLRKNYFDGIYKQGLYRAADGVFVNNNLEYCSNENKIYTNGMHYIGIVRPQALAVGYVMFYQENDTFISSRQLTSDKLISIPSNTNYVRISVKKGDNIYMKPTEAPQIYVYLEYIENSTTRILKNSLDIFSINLLNFQHLNWNPVNQVVTSNTLNYLGTIHPIKLNEDKVISCDSGYRYSYCKYSELINYPDATKVTSYTSWLTEPTILKKDDVVTFNFQKTDASNLDLDDIEHFHINSIIENKVLTQNYYIDSMMSKHNISIERLGNLKYDQSFCIYDGYYYSTDGSNIAKQDMTDFTTINDVAIDVGHGNSMQIGNDGYCYISGWDDNTIYKVDLDTITLNDTITLPTTGYTTSAIDTDNKIAYIFQRDTNPETETNYNFIAYDYDNDSILYTRKTPKFGAMQACDLYEDRILVASGFGSLGTQVPNHFRVYSINGNVLGEFVIGQLSTKEPEGVYIDKETLEIYIYFYDSGLWKITL